MIRSFAELYTADYNLTKIFAMKQKWNSGRTFVMNHPRPTNALLFLCGCDAVYKTDEKSIDAPSGSVFFIPSGAEYSWTFFNADQKVSTILFEFVISDNRGKVIPLGEAAGVLPFGDCEVAKILFGNLTQEFQKPLSSPTRIKAAAFSLLAALSRAGKKNEIKKEKFGLIYKGIKYLEDEPHQEKSIAEIAAMCNISTNYFERLFREYSGCTPSQYRLNKRIERAKIMLSADVLSVKQISDELGFEDGAYFCRVFKNAVGCTPKQYRELSEI